ncbi:MAG: hypothetical protein ABJL67_11475 [Sulfitobacter sp.]
MTDALPQVMLGQRGSVLRGQAHGHLAEWITVGVDGIAVKSCQVETIQICFSIILEGGSNFTHSVLCRVVGHEQRPDVT